MTPLGISLICLTLLALALLLISRKQQLHVTEFTGDTKTSQPYESKLSNKPNPRTRLSNGLRLLSEE
jgi:hypothetical protein